DLQRTEENARKSHKQLRDAQQLAHIGVWTWTAETDTVTWTEELYRIAGIDPMLPAPTYAEHPNLYVPESWDRLKEAVERAREAGVPYQLELELIRPDGATRWVNAFGGAIYDHHGRLTGLQGTVQDITERKLAETMLRDSEALYQSLVNHLPQCVFRKDLESRFTFANLNFCRLLGKTSAEILGRTDFDFYPPALAEKYRCDDQRIMREGRLVELVEQHVLPDGKDMIVQVVKSPLVNAAGETVGLQALFGDITAQKRAEEKLQSSEIRYRRLFESAKEGILILDAETGQIVDANPFLMEMLGFSHEQLLGKAVWDLGILKDLIANQDNFLELQQKEYIRYEDLPLETADGRHIDVEFVSNVYLVDNKKVIQCDIRDNTERKRAEAEKGKLQA
ncbi:MAG: PAS domain S-box protein, partial [Syntrophales bacterium LBB04]|nr:PAS domain S-box protein [Syntrophales bacterium LBB04]